MKRSFSGLLMLTVSVVFLTLMMLAVITQIMYYRSSVSALEERLNSAAEAAADMSGIFGADDSVQGKFLFRFQLNYTARATDTDVLVLSPEGEVTVCSCGMQDCEHLGSRLPQTVLAQTGAEPKFFSRVSLDCYEGSRMASVAATEAGFVVCSVDAAELGTRMEQTSLFSLLAVLAVILLALPVTWYLLQRQVKPLRQLTAAARRLAHGQMDARVSTGGSNSAELEELAVAFNNMAQSLQQSEQRRQEFIANVSHELKTPMTTISGYMDGMLDGTIPPEQQPRYMRIIADEVRRLSRMVRNMLEVSRIRTKGVPPERKRVFDACETVGQVLISFEQKINAKKLQVEAELPEQGAKAYADPDAITQVVYNLLDNAVKFCPEGGVLTVGICETRQNKYLVSVRNTGPTIPPEELPLVFDRFHKTDKSRSMDRDGVGLGLYIVREILGAHEEDVFVTSKDGVTEFSFTLSKP